MFIQLITIDNYRYELEALSLYIQFMVNHQPLERFVIY
jgi:hypothetical protein